MTSYNDADRRYFGTRAEQERSRAMASENAFAAAAHFAMAEEYERRARDGQAAPAEGERPGSASSPAMTVDRAREA